MYDGIKLFLEWVGYFFIAYLIGYSTFLFLSVVVGSLELYKHRRQEMFKSILPSDYYLPISIIVPAYNEEVTVADTVRSLLALDYRSYEIIVVDDGSKDRTSEVLAETFDMHLVHRPIRRQINCQREEYVYETRAQKVPVTLIRKKNGGKADALNMGINAANFPYFICMDADANTPRCATCSPTKPRRFSTGENCPISRKTAMWWRLAASSASPTMLSWKTDG